MLQCVAVRCSALQCGAVCRSALQYGAVRCSKLHCIAVRCRDSVKCTTYLCGGRRTYSVCSGAALYFIALQCVAVRLRDIHVRRQVNL